MMAGELPYLTTEQMVEVDRAMIEDARIELTLALPKEGLRTPAAEGVVGELNLADISVPPKLYSGPGLDLQVGPLFAREEILRIR